MATSLRAVSLLGTRVGRWFQNPRRGVTCSFVLFCLLTSCFPGAQEIQMPEQVAAMELDEVALELPVYMLPVPIAKPESLAGRWLLVVQSDADASAPLKVRKDLKDSRFEIDFIRVYSSYLDGLEPCRFVTVAQSYSYREEARYWSRQMERLGIASEVQYAGEMAALDGNIEDWCQREMDSVSETCPYGMRWLASLDQTTWMEIGEAENSTVESILSWEHMGDKEGVRWWRADATPALSDDVALGEVWQGFGVNGVSRTCRVTGFEILARGIPHHRHAEDPSRVPTCGTPKVFARMDCRGDLVWALPKGSEAPRRYRILPDEPVWASVLAQTMVRLTDSLGYKLARSRGEARAEEERLLIQESSEVHVLERSDGSRALLVRATLTTDDGVRTCDEGKVHSVIVGVVDMEGRVLSAFREGEGHVLDVVDLDQNGQLEVLQEVWPHQQWFFDEQGSTRCRMNMSYCDSPCGGVIR